MDIIKKIIKKIAKNIMLIVLSSATLAMTFYTIVKAVDSEENNSGASNDSADAKLTSEEIDKIIDDLKVSGDIDNITEKLDEIIERAKLAGNTELQEYAENMKKYYELKNELDSVHSLIEASKKKNSSIAAVDEEVSRIISLDKVADDFQGALSDEALLILKSLSEDDLKKLQDLIAKIDSFMDLRDVTSLTVQQRSLLDLLILGEIINNDMLEGEKLDTAKNTLSVAVTILESYARQEYSDEEYDRLIKGSEEFSKSTKKGQTVAPEQIMFLNGYFNLKHAPIMYDGHILLAVDDLYQYIDGTIEYMYNNAVMVIQSPNKTLEIESGKNVAYLNDEPKNMNVPILSYKNTIYMSAEFFAEAYDIDYKYDAEHEFLIFYNNLVQLANTSVPNQINKG
ncbi:MAG: copper amine oxidase N-terminal domain-containing protein [Clostridia bacterium]|nr:copper amine oxidase N-terminal domain-containing protein [Clostridia bacterium]MBR2735476.1 copper amine oxidase N-terminal domain-containing protein [Clostridia bacterium]